MWPRAPADYHPSNTGGCGLAPPSLSYGDSPGLSSKSDVNPLHYHCGKQRDGGRSARGGGEVKVDALKKLTALVIRHVNVHRGLSLNLIKCFCCLNLTSCKD